MKKKDSYKKIKFKTVEANTKLKDFSLLTDEEFCKQVEELKKDKEFRKGLDKFIKEETS